MSRSRPLTPSERLLIARQGAYAQQAQNDTHLTTARAREVFHSRWERDVDPDGTLPPAERARRAEAAKKAYFTGLAYRSARSRARRSARTTERTGR